jgi:hypothetical protein
MRGLCEGRGAIEEEPVASRPQMPVGERGAGGLMCREPGATLKVGLNDVVNRIEPLNYASGLGLDLWLTDTRVGG